MPEERDYDVFLSYSMKDRAWVSEFADVLSQAGVRAWFDKAALPPGERWQEKIQEALRASKTLVLILSPQSIESPWTLFELGPPELDYHSVGRSYSTHLTVLSSNVTRSRYSSNPSPPNIGAQPGIGPVAGWYHIRNQEVGWSWIIQWVQFAA